MKAPISIVGALLLSTVAATHDAYLWTIDQGVPKGFNTQSSSINSDTATAILSRRRGLPEQRKLANLDEGTIFDINKFGGTQVPVFGLDDTAASAKLLIRISGYTGAVSSLPDLPDLWIESPAQTLLDDFKAREGQGAVCEYNLQVPMKEGVDIVFSYTPKDAKCPSSKEVRQRPELLTAFSSVPTAEHLSTGLISLLRILSHLAVSDKVESTLLVLPPTSTLTKPRAVRRDAAAVPDGQLSTRATSSPLPRNIPLCFASQSTCENGTNTCSGRGQCVQARTNCFSCKCTTTKTGPYTTINWGGNACEKKDISVPFMLFASFGVIMTTLVVGAISLLYKMGSQDLPSVIGAGVAGPRAQK